MPFKDFQYVGKHRYVSLNELDLQPGKSYRVVVKFCAENLCFPYVYSNGITVIYNPPVTGNISVEIKNTSLAHQEVGRTAYVNLYSDIKLYICKIQQFKY